MVQLDNLGFLPTIMLEFGSHTTITRSVIYLTTIYTSVWIVCVVFTEKTRPNLYSVLKMAVRRDVSDRDTAVRSPVTCYLSKMVGSDYWALSRDHN